MTNTVHSTVQLVEYNNGYSEQLIHYHLTEENLMFTTLPLVKIQDASQAEDMMHVLINHDKSVVGYFALEGDAKRAQYTANERARLFTSFPSIEIAKGMALQQRGFNCFQVLCIRIFLR
ncbi:hypothetical protein G4V62_16165 [Bacillaceae bacterium SIJ1]|uniref:hypothetical protein n=1 Tax=Litoribacterium kuwaitense TaxID=1398745 RepID=UPI0013ECF34D|nr:hypothetical protein [Litoribacterium kuwaitense]NGP46407.1 hypothetical protein [Litoribacterium kuwaitense]